MKLTLSSVCLLIAAVLFFSSCEKEYSFENGGIPGSGAAVFTLGGAPASCTGFVTAGTYTAGTALVAGNTVTFDVNVATAGTYVISTAAANGVTFSKTGLFSSTGSQTITLNGMGTPTAGGDFTYTVTNGSTDNCSYSITVVPSGPVATGTLDCAGFTSAGVYKQGTALTATNTVSIPVTVATAGSYSITTTVNGATFSGSGVLAAGAQTIVLTGSGTATNSGVTSYPLSLGASSCSFTIDFLPGTSPATDYLRCNLDGVAKTFNVNLSGTAPVVTGFSIDGFESSAANSPTLSLALNNLLGTVTVGTYDLLSITSPSAIFCFPVYDDGSVTWSQSINNQPGTFTVIVTSKTANRIIGTFSGTLYEADGAGPAAKVFTAGNFSVPY